MPVDFGLTLSSTPFDPRLHGAKGDGTTDDTAAFQATLNSAPAGSTVVVPATTLSGQAARWRIDGSLTIPAGVTLQGPYRTPTSTPGNRFYGTDNATTLNDSFLIDPMSLPGVILVTGGAGSASGTATITLGSNSAIEGIVAYWPNQPKLLSSGNAPTPYPYFVRMGPGVNASVKNVGVINPFQFLHVDGMWRPTVVDVVGQPYQMGVRLDNCYDVARLDRIHWECFWDAEEFGPGYFYQPWTLANGVGFQFDRCDLAQGTNIFAYGMGYGLVLDSADSTATNAPWTTFTNAHFDGCANPIVVKQAQAYGANFANCMITGGSGTSVQVQPTNTGCLSFANCLFVSNGTGLNTRGSGDISVVGCTFQPTSGSGSAAIVHAGGGLLASGCNFQGNATQYSNTSNAKWANLNGNRCKTGVGMANTASISAFLQANNLAY